MHVWDGEDDQFAISSIEGIERLVNLELFAPIAMIAENGIDYSPILRCERMAKVDMSFRADGPSNDAVLEELEKRGVEVEV